MSKLLPLSPPQPPPEHYVRPPLPVILIVVLLIIIFVGFFTLYFCKWFLDSMIKAWRLHHGGAIDNPLQSPAPPSPDPGLDIYIINSFPTFLYSSVKDLRDEKYSLECAICLLEFDDDHMLRLLKTCYHVFHQECIDLWFKSHKTCPVCRGNLDTLPPENTNIGLPNLDEMIIDVIQETIDDDDEEEHNHRKTTPIDTWPSSGQSSFIKKEQTSSDKFSRSHSTGHSIVRRRKPEEEEDKYTLRLSEHVKIKVTRRHNHAESCVTFAELVKNRGCNHRRFGEISGQTHSES